MRTRGRLGGTLLALLLALAGAGLAVAGTSATAAAGHRVVRAVESLPQAAGLGHSGHPVIGKPHLHAPGVPAASTVPAGLAVAVLVAFAAAAAVVTRDGRRFARAAAIRAPPRGQ